MASYTVLPNQTLPDIAIMTTGTVENLFAIATANSIAVSDDLAVGTILAIPDGLTTDANTLSYIAANSVLIATNGAYEDVFDDTFGDEFG